MSAVCLKKAQTDRYESELSASRSALDATKYGSASVPAPLSVVTGPVGPVTPVGPVSPVAPVGPKTPLGPDSSIANALNGISTACVLALFKEEIPGQAVEAVLAAKAEVVTPVRLKVAILNPTILTLNLSIFINFSSNSGSLFDFLPQ
jgi:hypothetical protein